MRNSPPAKPYCSLDNQELLEELCLALRDVGVWQVGLASWSRDRGHVELRIERVKEIHTLLIQREIDISARLERLSTETGWQMPTLLCDTLQYPRKSPYVRLSNGIRSFFRCWLCHQAEHPEGVQELMICDNCLSKAIAAMRSKTSFDGVELIRAVTLEEGCPHADVETLLLRYTDCGDIAYCERCLVDELQRRQAQLS